MNSFESEVNNRIQQLRKGVIEYLLLLVLDKESHYAGAILKEFKTSGIDVVEGTLYPLLSRLSKQKIVDYRWEEAKTGHLRKYYRLSTKGKKMLKELRKTWNDMESSVTKLQK